MRPQPQGWSHFYSPVAPHTCGSGCSVEALPSPPLIVMSTKSSKSETCLPIAAGLIFCGALVECDRCATRVRRTNNCRHRSCCVRLGALAALASNFEIEVESRIAISGHVMVATASLLVFYELDFLLGPLLVGLFGGLYVPHLREKKYSIIAINSGADCLALFAGVLVFKLLAPTHPTTPVLLIVMTISSLVFLTTNGLLLSWPISIARGERFSAVARQMTRINASSFPFALLGLGVGWVYLELGAWVVPILVVPVIIARQAFARPLAAQVGAGAHDRDVDSCARSEGSLHGRSRAAGRDLLRVHRRRVRIHSASLGAPALRGAHARHRQAHRAEPVAQQAGPSHRSRVRPCATPRDGVGRAARRIDFLAPVAGDTTTEAATAAVTGTCWSSRRSSTLPMRSTR